MSASRIVLALSALCLPGALAFAATSQAEAASQQQEPTATAAGETPEQARAKLNTEQAEAAKSQLDQNAANAASYAAAVKARDEEISRPSTSNCGFTGT